jgi:hypothetical protein
MKRKHPPHDADAMVDPRPTPRRERQTLIPSFDPETLAREVETSGVRPTSAPPFDPAAYARIVDAHVQDAVDARDTPRTLTAVPQATMVEADVETIGRSMYGRYLASEFPEALELAEQVLVHQPDHALAQLVAMRSRARLASEAPRLQPSSVVRIRGEADDLPDLDLDPTSVLVLRHVDGVSDAETVAELVAIPRDEALDRLHELLELGVVEVVAATG